MFNTISTFDLQSFIEQTSKLFAELGEYTKGNLFGVYPFVTERLSEIRNIDLYINKKNVQTMNVSEYSEDNQTLTGFDYVIHFTFNQFEELYIQIERTNDNAKPLILSGKGYNYMEPTIPAHDLYYIVRTTKAHLSKKVIKAVKKGEFCQVIVRNISTGKKNEYNIIDMLSILATTDVNEQYFLDVETLQEYLDYIFTK